MQLRNLRRPTVPLLVAVVALPLLVAACGDDGSQASADAAGGDTAEATAVRLGVFPNVTHAPGLIGVEQELFAEALGDDVELTTQYFNAGGEAVEAIFGGQIDITFIGPNPAINAFAQSDGEAVRIIAGSTSGGASLVVRDGIDEPADLAGTTLASPALGNTQDVALRAWLADEGFETDATGAGDVAITPIENPDILEAFQRGDLDGAWVPEPWATRLVEEADGTVLVDEADLWPDGEFVTTHVVARTEFLEQHPGTVRAFLEAHLDALEVANGDADEAQTITLDGIEAITGNRLNEEIIAAAWENLTFTADPIASSLTESAEDATTAGLLDPVELDGIYDLAILNELLAERGEEEVSDQ
jgi:NitT/TauT family transport system substrate-binding protein